VPSKNSIFRKSLEFSLGYVDGLIGHSFLFPTSLRKDLTMKAKPGDIKLSEDHYCSARQAGYSISLINGCEIGWAIPVMANYFMYKGLSENAPELVPFVIGGQIGLNIGSAIYEVGRLVRKRLKQKTISPVSQ